MPRIRQRCTQQRAAARPRPFRGDYLEQQVWSDIETFLRNPEPVLQQLQARLESDAKGSEGMQKQITRLTVLLDEKATERTRIVGLYRAVGSAKPNSTRKMDDIGAEEKALEAQLSELRGRVAGAESIAANINSAQTLLV